MEPDHVSLTGLIETYDIAIAELENLDDPAVGTLLASLRTLRERAERQAEDGTTHLLALS